MFPDLTRDDVFRLETARLWLRWPRAVDVPALLAQVGRRAVAEMTARIPHPLSEADIAGFVLASRLANLEGSALTMAITPRARPGAPIGIVSIEPGRTGPVPQLGYWLGQDHWGDGLMTEAASALVDAFFAYTDGTELTSSARVTNPASRRVLEKCGFSAVGSALEPFPARNAVLPVDLFKLQRRDWRGFTARWSGAFGAPRAYEARA